MIPDGARAWRPLLLLAALAVPARAGFRGSGLLAWSFDDITVNSGVSRVHASQWAQLYKLDLDGPLVFPSFGTMRHGVSYSEGASLSQTVNTGIPHQRTMAYAAGLDLFSPRVQQFVRVSPSFSRSYIHSEGQTYAGPYSNTVADTTWGLYSSLSLPLLPALSYSRQVRDHRNPSDTNPVNQRGTTETKTADYIRGHVVLHASQQKDQTDDLLGTTPAQQTDFRQAWLEANYYQPKWWSRLQSFYFRTDLSENKVNGFTGSKQGGANLGLSTQRFKTGRWDSVVNYAASGSRDFLGGRHTLSQNASLNSTRELRPGKLSNAFSVSHSPDLPGESLSDLVGFNRPLWRGRAALSLTASGGWSHSPASTVLSDGLSGRWDLFPARPRNYFAEAVTSGSKYVRGSGGSRVDRYAAGATDRFNTRSVTARLDRTRQSFYASGTTSTSDQLSLEATGKPSPKLNASAGYSLGVVEQQQARSTNHNVHGSLTYEPVRGATLFASLTWANQGTTAVASASYVLGKTVMSLSYEHRQLSSPATFSRLSVSLTRYL